MHSKDSITIIGFGKMGRFFHRKLVSLGYTIYALDKEDLLNAAEVLTKSRLILLSVPVRSLKPVLTQIQRFLDPGRHILSDITSVKLLPMQYMQEAFKGAVVGTHPLFGPEPKPSDMKAAIIPGENAAEEAVQYLEELYGKLDCRTFRCSAQEHDHGVGVAQSLNFAVSAAFFSLLAREKGIRPFLTPSFKRHLQAAKKHLTVDKEMFCEFTEQNPEFNKALRDYDKIIREMIQGGLKKISDEAAIWYETSV
jgi:prephenate dehydrogenase